MDCNVGAYTYIYILALDGPLQWILTASNPALVSSLIAYRTAGPSLALLLGASGVGLFPHPHPTKLLRQTNLGAAEADVHAFVPHSLSHAARQVT